MKSLIICSYLCAAAGFLLWCLLAVDVMDSVASLDDETLFFVLLAPPPVLQWLYVRRMAGLVNLRQFKPSKALDELSLNDLDSDGEIVTTGAGWKAVNTVNSLILSLFFIMITFSVPYMLPQLLAPDYEEAQDFILPVILFLYVVSVPTIVFNLRTFDLKRIRLTKG